MRSNGANGKGRQPAPRVHGSNGASRKGAPDSSEGSYELLTAALIGVAVGAGATYLLRRGYPTGHRPIEPAWRFAKERGGRVQEKLRDRYDSAKETFDDFVESEIDDLRRALKRRRKKLGL